MIFLRSETELRSEILEAGKRIYAKGMVASNDGNISCRLENGNILITPTGVCKGDMINEQLLVVDMNGNIITGSMKPTSEMKMHLAVYRMRQDVGAVVHAHPQKATAFTVVGIGLDKITLPEVVFSLKRIALVPYGTPSTEEIPLAIEKHIMDSNALLLSNHGALTVGSSPLDAYFNMETLEHFASITLYARQLGSENALNEQQIQRLFEVRKDVFGKV